MRASLRTKWSMLFLAVGVVPLAAFAYVTIAIQKAGLERAEKEIEVAVVDEASQTIARQLDDAADVTHRVGQVLTDGRITEDEVRLSLASDAVARAPSIDFIAIYSTDGAFIDAIVRGDESKRQVATPKHLTVGDHDAGTWLPPELGPDGVELRYLEPMLRDGRRRGWVLGRVSPGKMGEELSELSRARFGRADRVLLIDASSRVIAAPGESAGLIGQWLGGDSAFAHLRMPGEGIGVTAEFTDARGVRMVGTVRTLPERGWAVVVQRPESEAFDALHDSRRAFLIAAAAFAVIAAGFGAALAARTTRPIKELVELTRAYAGREFSRRSRVKTGDELEELGTSMTDMADSLAAGEKEIARRIVVEAELSRYLPAEVARAVAAGKSALKLGGERRRISIVFADVANFTSFAEVASPEHVVAFLNELFTVLSEVVFRHRGIVDKFMGDCIMAVFGVSDEGTEHARYALSCAEDMQRFTETMAPRWRDAFGFEVRLGIGVATGEAVVGNLGSEARVEYTAIGDVVNVAARLETLARPGQTLLTADVARSVAAGFTFHSLGEHPIRGKKRTVEVLEMSG